MIININEVLPNLPGILELDRDFDSTALVVFQGALITMRAWAYFNLYKLNGVVGYIEGNLTNIDAKITLRNGYPRSNDLTSKLTADYELI